MPNPVYPSLPCPANAFLLHPDAFVAIQNYVSQDEEPGSLSADERQKQRQFIPNVEKTPKLGGNRIDLHRVIRRSPDGRRSIAWAIRELLQNTFDHSHAAVAVGEPGSVWYPFQGVDSIICIGRHRKAAICIAFDQQEGLFICQFGRPLSKAALGSGTEAKVRGAFKGGFGDGFKSAMEVLLQHRSESRFRFYNAKPPTTSGGMGRRSYCVDWTFSAQRPRMDDPQKHMTVDIACTLDKDHNLGAQHPTKTPFMVTHVRNFPVTSTECLPLAYHVAQALGSFLALYEHVPLASSIAGLADDDRWVSMDKLVPIVDTFAGYAIGVSPYSPHSAPRAVFKGILYEVPPGYFGGNSVIFFRGKGLRHDPEVAQSILAARGKAIFKSPDRDVDPIGLTYRFTDQVVRFLSSGVATRDAAAAALLDMLYHPPSSTGGVRFAIVRDHGARQPLPVGAGAP